MTDDLMDAQQDPYEVLASDLRALDNKSLREVQKLINELVEEKARGAFIQILYACQEDFSNKVQLRRKANDIVLLSLFEASEQEVLAFLPRLFKEADRGGLTFRVCLDTDTSPPINFTAELFNVPSGLGIEKEVTVVTGQLLQSLTGTLAPENKKDEGEE